MALEERWCIRVNGQHVDLIRCMNERGGGELKLTLTFENFKKPRKRKKYMSIRGVCVLSQPLLKWKGSNAFELCEIEQKCSQLIVWSKNALAVNSLIHKCPHC